jgi:hypothetical protein
VLVVVLISLLFLCVVYWSVCACVLDCVVCVVLCLFWSGCACVHVCVVYSDFVFLFVLFFLCLCWCISVCLRLCCVCVGAFVCVSVCVVLCLCLCVTPSSCNNIIVLIKFNYHFLIYHKFLQYIT